MLGTKDAFALLDREGEAFYNSTGGLPQSNTRFQVAYAGEEQRQLLCRKLMARHPGLDAVVFEGNRPATLLESRPLRDLLAATTWQPRPKAVKALLGQPVTIGRMVAVAAPPATGKTSASAASRAALAELMQACMTCPIIHSWNPPNTLLLRRPPPRSGVCSGSLQKRWRTPADCSASPPERGRPSSVAGGSGGTCGRRLPERRHPGQPQPRRPSGAGPARQQVRISPRRPSQPRGRYRRPPRARQPPGRRPSMRPRERRGSPVRGARPSLAPACPGHDRLGCRVTTRLWLTNRRSMRAIFIRLVEAAVAEARKRHLIAA
jgi:hypothetical protein